MRAGKNNFAEVFVYAAIIGVLLAWRAWRWLRGRKASVPAAQAGARARPSN